MNINNEQLNEVVQRIIYASNPLKIILFGSTARGEANQESDIDVLVIVSDGTNRLQTTQNIYKQLLGLKIDIDIVVATVTDIENYKDTAGMVYREALRDGKMLYAA